MASGELLDNTGSAARCSVDDLEGQDGDWEGGSEGGGIYVLIADSHCCTAEIKTTL